VRSFVFVLLLGPVRRPRRIRVAAQTLRESLALDVSRDLEPIARIGVRATRPPVLSAALILTRRVVSRPAISPFRSIAVGSLAWTLWTFAALLAPSRRSFRS
jgi:hypothetical protein